MPKPKVIPLTIFLIKEEVDTPENVFLNAEGLERHEVTIDGQQIGSLFIRTTSEKAPSWLGLFSQHIQRDGTPLVNANTAAALVVSAADRRFVLTFGYGRNLLKPGTWVEDFGIKVTLNTVDPAKIRSIDRLRFDPISQHSQVQASREAAIGDFGLDVEQDLLRSVTGAPSDPTLGVQLTGKDALQVRVGLRLEDFGRLLARLLASYADNTYLQHFAFVDQVAEVRDVARVATLDSQLIQRLLDREFDKLWLAIPEPLRWEDVRGFKYRGFQSSRGGFRHPR